MKKQSTVVIGLLALLVIGVIAVIAVNGKGSDSTASQPGATSQVPPATPPTSSGTATENRTPQPAPANPTAAAAVTIKDYAFGPKDITVKAGTTVTWTNQDSVHHTVTADKPSADAPKSELFGKGETYSFTFKKAGTYSYYCEPHPYMKATVTVTE